MDPIVTAITTLLSYWGGKAFDKAFDTATGEFTKDSVNWLKSLFYKDDQPAEITLKYEEKPESPARQEVMKAAILTELEDNPQTKKFLNDLLKTIEMKLGTGIRISGNILVQGSHISSGGDTIIGTKISR